MSGKVYLVGAGPGDAGLITVKGKECIEMADVLLYDRLVASELLEYASHDAKKIYVGKDAHHHTVQQEEIQRLLVHYALEGHTVVRLKGGDPFVFGRGAEEAEMLREHHIAYEIVPGVTSAIAAPAYAGIPITHRNYSGSFHVITGHECVDSKVSDQEWQALAKVSGTIVILMGLGHLCDISERLISYGKSPETPCAVISMGTTHDQRTIIASLATVAEKCVAEAIMAPATVVIGDIVSLHDRLTWFAPQMAIKQ
ncbi:MAG: uroporphyrinogen-III C-methyltransferase [Acidibacillus sp.]|uniref:Uroporphyrinogen-III C-methyltransferase n=1 Tax=Sulfoacidibacillus ferrooxidans TaxID=2005001 RepID=A0A9X2ABJ6_9BACL|nr:uroporphyrinogen-III C-methyltransferase [Sulfoacidibacillus ferrooxidans]MCI0183083.1 Uroporphyrinogen-III C-methyltransferase [Sulfoacidibacillus ferrooxidans]MCY0893207.1 uroporphyrinogen-III C-methyltransferase [Acidibacillus sp.]